MSLPYLHLLLNHVPLLGAFFGICLLIYGLWSKQQILQKAAFAFFVLSALVSIPVMHTGEEAEELVENMPGVSHDVVEHHEEAAKPAYFAILATGVFSLLALLMPVFGRMHTKTVTVIILLLSIASFFLLGRAALDGGKIIHKEMHGGNAVQQDTATPAEEEHED